MLFYKKMCPAVCLFLLIGSLFLAVGCGQTPLETTPNDDTKVGGNGQTPLETSPKDETNGNGGNSVISEYPLPPDGSVPSTEAGGSRFAPTGLEYLGAFRLPADDEWAWSGEALAFHAAGNGGAGSLFGTGHNHRMLVAEISIPEPVVSPDVSALPQAKTLQPFASAWGGLYDHWYTEIPRVGLEVLHGRLYFCRGEHFQEEGNPETHGYSTLNLAGPEPQGLWRIGDDSDNYATNDYMFKIPPQWSDRYAPGYDLATGRYRDGGWGGMGPSLFILKTEEMQNNTHAVQAKEVIRYTDVDDWSAADRYQVDSYCEADTWTGGAWIDSPAGSAVVFCGNHGFSSKTWYGFANGVVYPIDGTGPFPEVPAHPYDQRGWWNADLRPALLFYDADDLGKVALGVLPPDQVQPYAILDISAYIYAPLKDTTMYYVGAMAYDDAGQRLLVQELLADGEKPVIHVFSLSGHP